MRAKPIVTTLFVGSLAIAAVAATHMLSQKSAGQPKAQILAATVPLPQGTLLREQDVTWQGVTETKPGEIVRPNAAALEANPALENQIRGSVYGAVLRHELPRANRSCNPPSSNLVTAIFCKSCLRQESGRLPSRWPLAEPALAYSLQAIGLMSS